MSTPAPPPAPPEIVYRPYNHTFYGVFTSRQRRRVSSTYSFEFGPPWTLRALFFPRPYFMNYQLHMNYCDPAGAVTPLSSPFNAGRMASLGNACPVEPPMLFPKNSKLIVTAELPEGVLIGRGHKAIRVELIGETLHIVPPPPPPKIPPPLTAGEAEVIREIQSYLRGKTPPYLTRETGTISDVYRHRFDSFNGLPERQKFLHYKKTVALRLYENGALEAAGIDHDEDKLYYFKDEKP
jgi:hypothetical protein